MKKVVGFCRYEAIGNAVKIFTFTALEDGLLSAWKIESEGEFTGTQEEFDALLAANELTGVSDHA